MDKNTVLEYLADHDYSVEVMADKIQEQENAIEAGGEVINTLSDTIKGLEHDLEEAQKTLAGGAA